MTHNTPHIAKQIAEVMQTAHAVCLALIMLKPYRCLRESGAVLEELWKLSKVCAGCKVLHVLYAGDGLFSSGPQAFCTLKQQYSVTG